MLRRGRLWPQRGLLADGGNSHRALPSVLCCTSSLIYTWLSGAKRTRLTLPAYFLLSLVTSLCRVIPAEAQVGSTETFKDALLGPRLTLHLHTCPALPLRAPYAPECRALSDYRLLLAGILILRHLCNHLFSQVASCSFGPSSALSLHTCLVGLQKSPSLIKDAGRQFSVFLDVLR